MSFLGDLINTIGAAVGGHPQQAQGHPALPMAQMAQRAVQPQQQGYSPSQQHQMIPVGQPIPQDFMNSFSPQTRALAQIYQSNPMDPRVAHLDPAMFGYAPDKTVSGFGSLPPQKMPNLPNALQGGPDNPGYIPFQNGGFGAPGAFQLQGGQDLQLQSGNSRQNLTPRF